MVFFATLYGFCTSSHLDSIVFLTIEPASRSQEHKIASRIMLGLAVLMYILSIVPLALAWNATRIQYSKASNAVELITAFKPWHNMARSIVFAISTLMADFTFVCCLLFVGFLQLLKFR